MATHRRCIICDKPRDPETKLCPTPEACDRLRAPAQRLKNEAAATARRAQAARTEYEHLGLTKARGLPPLPGDEQRHADAVRRATTGWKRPRRASQRERVA